MVVLSIAGWPIVGLSIAALQMVCLQMVCLPKIVLLIPRMESEGKVEIPERSGFIGNQIMPVSGQADESIMFRDRIGHIVCIDYTLARKDIGDLIARLDMGADLIPAAAAQVPDLVKADHINLLRVLPIIIIKMEPLAGFEFHICAPLIHIIATSLDALDEL